MSQQKSIPLALRNNIAGVTLIELILTIGILLILSTAAIPLFQMTVQHRKETELRYDLREMRKAIDRYKDDADKNLIQTSVGSQNYPPDLQTLVDGVTISSAQGVTGGISASALAGASGTSQFGSAGTPQMGAGQPGGASPFGANSTSGSASQAMGASAGKVRYLRKIPVDPMTGKPDWGLRAVQDDPDSDSWGGGNVFDVHSQSQATATDGTKYSDW
jgi:general secretion pathway protein G